MKKNILLLLLLVSYSINSQSLSKKKIYKLNDLNIKVDKLNLSNFNVQKDLNKILILEKKRKTNKTVGIILSSISIGSVILGGILKSKNNELTDVFGGIMITGGAVLGGVSLPFWNSSKKRKKERDALIKMFDQ